MARNIVAGYRLDEATRRSLLPPPPPESWLDADLSALEATEFDHREVCAGTPRRSALAILRRDADASFLAAGGDFFGERT